MIDIPKITATINTEEVETVELAPIVATIETRENFVELQKVVADIRPETAIVGNLGTMVAGKGKDGKDGVDGRPGRDGLDGKPGRDGIDGKDGKDGTTPHIGDNGNWFIDDFDTGVCAVGKTGITGAPGKDGYTPRLGIDYFNGKDGRDGLDGKPGKDGKNGRTPIKGIDYKDGKDGKDGLNGLNGTDGFSPKVSVEEIEGGHKITITDKDGEKSFDVMDGQGGNGDGGTGENGFSPTISVEEIENGHRITITDIDGTKTFDVFNGKNGKDGEPGYTPIKGVDYFDGLPGKDGKDGLDGQPGKDGYTPIKGVDYFDGEPGKPGADGKDGYTPVKGVDYFDGQPGADGKDGSPGADGYTPQRGKDYWTDSDIQAMVTDAVNGVLAQKSTILEVAYPIGAIYLSTVSTSPQTLFGFGTWEQIKDRFLLAAGSTYSAGSTGGAATHTLTVDEIPSHGHTIRNRDGTGPNGLCASSANSGTDGNSWCFEDVPYDGSANSSGNFAATTTGGGQPHNNMPPYLAVYVWKRTA